MSFDAAAALAYFQAMWDMEYDVATDSWVRRPPPPPSAPPPQPSKSELKKARRRQMQEQREAARREEDQLLEDAMRQAAIERARALEEHVRNRVTIEAHVRQRLGEMKDSDDWVDRAKYEALGKGLVVVRTRQELRAWMATEARNMAYYNKALWVKYEDKDEGVFKAVGKTMTLQAAKCFAMLDPSYIKFAGSVFRM